MYIIEKGFGTEGNESDYLAFIVIAENAEELGEAEKEYRIGDRLPETDETITTAQGLWSKKIYLFGDAGDGVIIYAPLKD